MNARRYRVNCRSKNSGARKTCKADRWDGKKKTNKLFVVGAEASTTKECSGLWNGGQLRAWRQKQIQRPSYSGDVCHLFVRGRRSFSGNGAIDATARDDAYGSVIYTYWHPPLLLLSSKRHASSRPQYSALRHLRQPLVRCCYYCDWQRCPIT